MELIQNTDCKEWQRDKALIICNGKCQHWKKDDEFFLK